jgi:hypothetical protein
MHFSRRQMLALSGMIAANALTFGEAIAAAPVHERDPTKDVLGADCYSYPGDDIVDALWKLHNTRIFCFYLSHSSTKLDESWSKDVRERFVMNGWGLLPTYNGTQNLASLTVPQGTKDAKQAADLMVKRGFETGRICYLDVEDAHGESEKYWDYVHAWIAEIKNQKFYPGIYSVYPNASAMAKLTSAAWTAELPTSPQKFKTTPPGQIQPLDAEVTAENLFEIGILAYDPKKYPHGKIYEGCIATQYLFKQFPKDIAKGKLELDYIASLVADPSDPANLVSGLNISSLI